MSFSKRKITFQFSVGQGQFGEHGADTVEVSGVRASVQITKTGGASFATMTARIWGLPLEIMKRLTVQNLLAYQDRRLNSITVLAGDDESGLGVCFRGNISEAWADFNNMPDVCFLVTAQTAQFESAVPVPPISFNGNVDVVTMLSGIATQMGRGLQNNGVTSRAVNPYYSGALLDQLKAIARDYEINYDDDGMNIAIWPSGGDRGDEIRIISPETGMVGYPMFTQNTISMRTLFDAGLAFGQTLKIVSQIISAEGRWTIAAVTHNIESEMPSGEWFTHIECNLFGHSGALVT